MAFHIPAYITILPVILLFLLQSSKIIDRLNKKQKKKQAPEEAQEEAPAAEKHESESLKAQLGTVEGSRLEGIEDDEEEPKEEFQRIKYFILLLNITLFCNTSTQQVVEAYIYEYSRCSPGKSHEKALIDPNMTFNLKFRCFNFIGSSCCYRDDTLGDGNHISRNWNYNQSDCVP